MTKTITSEIIWQPSGKYLESRVVDFMNMHGISDWKELIKRSNEDTEWFWQSALEYMGFQWHKPYTKLMDSSKGFEWTKWFVGGELNIISNTLDWHLEEGKVAGARKSVGRNHPALIWEGEDGRSRKLTYGELSTMTSKIASLLLKLNVKPGDAVGIYMPMVPEVVAVLLPALKLAQWPFPYLADLARILWLLAWWTPRPGCCSHLMPESVAVNSCPLSRKPTKLALPLNV